MSFVHLRVQEGIAEVRLERGKVNALNEQWSMSCPAASGNLPAAPVPGRGPKTARGAHRQVPGSFSRHQATPSPADSRGDAAKGGHVDPGVRRHLVLGGDAAGAPEDQDPSVTLRVACAMAADRTEPRAHSVPGSAGAAGVWPPSRASLDSDRMDSASQRVAAPICAPGDLGMGGPRPVGSPSTRPAWPETFRR